MSYITKNNVVPCLDVNKSLDYSNCDWTPIDLSEIFELTIGEVETERNFICFANPSTDVTGNDVELPQEIIMDKDNPMYQFIIAQIKSLPIGSDCHVPCMICFPDDTDGTFKTGADAWRYIATLTGKVLNTPDQKASFTIKKYSDIEEGTYEVSESQGAKTITFIPSNSSQG